MAKGRDIRIKPVDEERGVVDHPARGQMQVLYDKELFERTIRRERSSSYWFAASLWGMSGLVVGALLGAAFMFTSMRAAVPVALEAQSQAIAQERGRQAAEQHRPLTGDENSTPSQTNP
jgi:hypothetical protein